MTTYFLVIMFSYLLGSIPFGIIVSKREGVDLRKVGSHNIGATNVLRNVGKIQALIVLLSDALKGAVPVLLCSYIFPQEVNYQIAAAIAAVAGHIFSLYLKFTGGKGVATGLGALLAVSPLAGIISLLLWLLVAFASRYSSLAALITFFLLPPVMVIIKEPEEKVLFALIISVMVILRHRDNINKLIKGNESKIGHR